MLTLILVIFAVSILILAHEWGHFYAARKLGVKVEEFGFGFPPKIWSRVKNGIKYTVNLLPFGGFVKIFGEHGEGAEDPQSFTSRPARQRFLILAAGVFMNLAVAWAFFSISGMIGVPTIAADKSQNIPVSIVGILPNTPAEKSGLKFGDKILEMRGGEISLRAENEKDVRDFIDAYRGEEITITVERGNKILQIKSVPRGNFPAGEGPLGIALARLSVKYSSPLEAPWQGLKTMSRSVLLTSEGLVMIFKEIFIERKSSIAVSGPVGIFLMVQDSRMLGFSYVLQFVGLLSVNLAILNFLPIPALDGGRILFLVIEKIRRRRINPKWENLAHSLGFLFLILIMILVTYKDISHIL